MYLTLTVDTGTKIQLLYAKNIKTQPLTANTQNCDFADQRAGTEHSNTVYHVHKH